MTMTLTPGNLGKLKTRRAGDDASMPSVCVYGGPGTGKTTLCASAAEVPDMNPIIHLNIENGTQSISEKYPEITVVDIERFSELQEAYDVLARNKDKEDKSCAGYRTIIIDNLTEGQKLGAEHYVDPSGSKKIPNFAEFEMANWQDYNKISEMMRRLIRAFRELPCYVFFVAWEKDLSKGEKTHLWTPAFSKTFAEEAPGMMNDVYRLSFNKDGTRILTTARSSSGGTEIVAKDRTGKLPATVENPNMDLLWQYWTGKLIKTTEPNNSNNRTSTLVKRK
jgi:hypothetical protein